MQFVRIVDNAPQVTAEAEEYLVGIGDKAISVVGVIGPYRSGKSYLLNQMVGEEDMFKTSSTVNAQTRGLYLATKLVGDNEDIIMVDSEGFGNVQVDQNQDMNIFALVMLMCSRVLYNNPGPIKNETLDSLHLATKVCEMIGRSAPGFMDSLPPLMWVLRDWSLSMEREDGTVLTPTDYIQYSLDRADAKLAQGLRAVFPQQDAVALPWPTADEADLNAMDNLKPAFVAGMASLVDDVHMTSRPKVFGNGKGVLTGKMLCDMTKAFCKAISNGGAPQLKSVWQSVVDGAVGKAFEHMDKFLQDELVRIGAITDFWTRVAGREFNLVCKAMARLERHLLEAPSMELRTNAVSHIMDRLSKASEQSRDGRNLEAAANVVAGTFFDASVGVEEIIGRVELEPETVVMLRLLFPLMHDRCVTNETKRRELDATCVELLEYVQVSKTELETLNQDAESHQAEHAKALDEMKEKLELADMTHAWDTKNKERDVEVMGDELKTTTVDLDQCQKKLKDVVNESMDTQMKISAAKATIEVLEADNQSLTAIVATMRETVGASRVKHEENKRKVSELTHQIETGREKLLSRDKHLESNKEVMRQLQEKHESLSRSSLAEAMKMRTGIAKLEASLQLSQGDVAKEKDRSAKRRKTTVDPTALIAVNTQNEWLKKQYEIQTAQLSDMKTELSEARRQVKALEIQVLLTAADLK